MKSIIIHFFVVFGMILADGAFAQVYSFKKPIFLPASPKITPLLEMQGHACFGYFYTTEKYVDFYTPFWDCHKVPYYKFEQSQIPDSYSGGTLMVKTYFLKRTTKQCPNPIIQIEKNDSERNFVSINSFQTVREANLTDPIKMAQVNGLGCIGYPVYPLEKGRHIILKPDGKRPRPLSK